MGMARRPSALLALLALGELLLQLFLAGGSKLVLEAEGRAFERPLLLRPLRVGISYLHSVSLTRVEESYFALPWGLVLGESRWQDFLAGQPLDYDATERGFFVSRKKVFLGREWSYGFIEENEARISLEGKLAIRRPSGLVKIRVLRR